MGLWFDDNWRSKSPPPTTLRSKTRNPVMIVVNNTKIINNNQNNVLCYSDHSISTRVERLDEAIMEASRALHGEPSGLWQYSETSCWVRVIRRQLHNNNIQRTIIIIIILLYTYYLLLLKLLLSLYNDIMLSYRVIVIQRCGCATRRADFHVHLRARQI